MDNIIRIESTYKRTTYAKAMLMGILRSSTFYFMIVLVIALLVTSFLSRLPFTFPIVLFAAIILYYAVWVLYNCFAQKSSELFSKKQFIFSNKQVIVKTDSEEIIQWEAFKRWSIHQGYYVLSLTNNRWYPVSKSDIPSDQIVSFENLLKEKIDKTLTIIPKEGN